MSISGPDAFTDGLTQHGMTWQVIDGVVCFQVLAGTGPLAGILVDTGVAVTELQQWPMVPPHWAHLPADISISPTNASSTETRTGWLRHSRGIRHWGSEADPISAWLAHVRSVLAGAQP